MLETWHFLGKTKRCCFFNTFVAVGKLEKKVQNCQKVRQRELFQVIQTQKRKGRSMRRKADQTTLFRTTFVSIINKQKKYSPLENMRSAENKVRFDFCGVDHTENVYLLYLLHIIY